MSSSSCFVKPRIVELSFRNPRFLLQSIYLSFKKLNPLSLWRSPIIFVVEIAALFVTIEFFLRLLAGNVEMNFTAQIMVWLWLTAFFSTFSEAVAEGRGKAQAENLKGTLGFVVAKKLEGKKYITVPGSDLRVGDILLVEPGDTIPCDGEVIEGIASIDESAITGESAPVIRESGGDRTSVTGGTRVLSDWIKVRVTTPQGQTVLDKMIALVEGSVRQKTPNEVALTILLVAMTMIFLVVVVSIFPVRAFLKGPPIDLVILAALLITLIPTTIGGLLSAIGIAGMNRLLQVNVLATSGRAVEAAGDVDVMLFDKTGTITLGNRCAVEFVPMPGEKMDHLVDAVALASIYDETPEGRSIVDLAQEKYKWKKNSALLKDATPIPFTAQTRMSGIKLKGIEIHKGATDSVIHYVKNGSKENLTIPLEFDAEVSRIASSGGTPLAVAITKNNETKLLGIIYLKDVIKSGLKEEFAHLHRMGIRTVMITGDNPVTAHAIAKEAGIGDYIAQATPEAKLTYIRQVQSEGHLVAMCGDGSNDAPALSQADVAVAMNTGTPAAKEAGNMIDLDSNPTKIFKIVAVGKQMLITRGALTTFSIANDVAKYFAIVPAMFASVIPGVHTLNVMNLATPQSAILSAVIFNAMIIILLLPLALRGVKFKPAGAVKILRKNLAIYGVGGIILPFIGIKLIDMIICGCL